MREEDSVTGGELWRDVTALLSDGDRLRAMADASRARGRPDAADRIAETLLELASASREKADD
jgi:UDP-N-acetylglucosamine:LPS N-acetylglucosamine transferase